MSKYDKCVLSLYKRLVSLAPKKHFPLFLALFAAGTSILFSVPNYRGFDSLSEEWNSIIKKSADLTYTFSDYDERSWMSKKVFRLTVPVIMGMLKLNPLAVVIIQHAMGVVSLIIIYILCSRHFSRATAIIMTIAVAHLYIGRAAFYDLKFMWFDGFAFAFLFLSMWSRNIASVCICAIAAAFTDERAFIALSFVALYHIQMGLNRQGRIAINRQAIAVFFGMCAYLSIRLYLYSVYGMKTPTTGANILVLKDTIKYLPLSAWSVFGAYWLVLLIASISMMIHKNYFWLITYIGAFIGYLLLCGFVTDLTRSMSYSFPLFFAILFQIAGTIRNSDMFKLALVCTIINYIQPALVVCADWTIDNWYSWPAPIKIIQSVAERWL